MSPLKCEIYIPYLPCPCSPGRGAEAGMDEFQQVILDLKEVFGDRIVFLVYALNQHLPQFREKQEVVTTLQEIGKKGLPLIYINNKLVFRGRYPDLTEMKHTLEKIQAA